MVLIDDNGSNSGAFREALREAYPYEHGGLRPRLCIEWEANAEPPISLWYCTDDGYMCGNNFYNVTAYNIFGRDSGSGNYSPSSMVDDGFCIGASLVNDFEYNIFGNSI
jgi:hypothetical protein